MQRETICRRLCRSNWSTAPATPVEGSPVLHHVPFAAARLRSRTPREQSSIGERAISLHPISYREVPNRPQTASESRIRISAISARERDRVHVPDGPGSPRTRTGRMSEVRHVVGTGDLSAATRANRIYLSNASRDRQERARPHAPSAGYREPREVTREEVDRKR
jgi:hypothetical protein